jgi:transcriptional/translational regulatory protein YebC/TACO1
MPKQTLERAIARGEPRTLAEGMSAMTYEAMLPGGIAVVVYALLVGLLINSEALTDNKTRTVAKIKQVIVPAGGSLSRVLYLFARKGVLMMASEKSFDDVLEQAIEVGAEDVEEAEDNQIKVLKMIYAIHSSRSWFNLTISLPRLECLGTSVMKFMRQRQSGRPFLKPNCIWRQTVCKP